jgi:hypothetical protein
VQLLTGAVLYRRGHPLMQLPVVEILFLFKEKLQ